MSQHPENELDSHYVSHAEFTRFEAGINRWQEDMRMEARSFQEDIRGSIRSLAAEVRASQDKPTNWGWILTGVGTAATICALIGGIAYTAIGNRQDANDRRIERNEDALIKAVDAISEIRANRWSSDDHQAYERDQQLVLDRRFRDVSDRVGKIAEMVNRHQRDGHPATVLREIQNVRDIAERADRRSEENSVKKGPVE